MGILDVPPYSRAQIDATVAEFVRRQERQTSELAVLPVLTITPATAGFEPFQVQMQSFPNAAGGAGTYNHGVWMGWNASRHAGEHGTVDDKPAIYMGFEDNYYDDVGDLSFGAEWYVGYISPDGSSVAVGDLRPFYARILEADTNDPAKSVRAHVDMGSGAKGQFVVYAGLSQPILAVGPGKVQSTRNLLVTGNELALTPASGQAILSLRSLSPPAITFNISGIRAWTWLSSSSSVFDVLDKDGRVHMTLHQHANVANAQTTFNCSVRVKGRVGFYDTSPIPKPTGVPVTAEGIHDALVALGLISA